MLKKSRIIQKLVNMILKQSILFIESLKYCNWFDLYWRISQATRTLFTKKKIIRSENLMTLDVSGISDNDVSVNAKSAINKIMFIDMRKE